ncbi:hypothetical protein D8674_034380 [Pyrus ussuriensis x Pyrus communis]|uniref:Uncharacterized protein n=1 Tax=Pyrus ussuriensis x Pyrus communis TaxID=2448454 RepID=A0A5N5HP22_9ROSA|nr:hypothetical protein D8674_034380 [Pyrus ussuriensis x Pyrus communis]
MTTPTTAAIASAEMDHMPVNPVNPVGFSKNTRGPCQQLKTMKTNYNFDAINDDMLAYLNRLFSECYKQWKSNLHQYFELFDDPHFQEPGYVEGSNFLEIDVFANVYVQPGDELTQSLHPSIPSEYVSPVFLHHHRQNPSTPSIHSNEARRPSTLSPTPPPTSNKITKHLQTTCLQIIPFFLIVLFPLSFKTLYLYVHFYLYYTYIVFYSLILFFVVCMK